MADNGRGGALDSLPTWAKVVALVGFPVVAWFLTFATLIGWIPSRFSQACDAMMSQEASVRKILDVSVQHQAAQESSDGVRLGLLRQICRNTSTSDLLRAECGR